ncbi:nucleotide exchange factor GrpE [Blattabacterium cuenoti]|uniref:nucleotide exchange factor GrpE n=1 Tax=Blattabacterium cuenoti TaxID=1653831 RepID=UPI00163B6B1A|nr:nucleotide exchange factor GrpE [Blattabacterium cuenoti]
MNNIEKKDLNKNTPTNSHNNKEKEFELKNIHKKKYNKKNVELKSDKKEEKNEEYELKIKILKNKLEKEKEKFLRLFAEFDNYKKRIKKEKFDIFRIIHEQIIIDLIPVLDDFERGIKNLKKSEEEKILKGILLIQEKFIKILKEKGLNKIKINKGDEFNTDLHEAITQIPATTEKLKGKIIEIIENGYILKEKVIRHAKVITGK